MEKDRRREMAPKGSITILDGIGVYCNHPSDAPPYPDFKIYPSVKVDFDTLEIYTDTKGFSLRGSSYLNISVRYDQGDYGIPIWETEVLTNSNGYLEYNTHLHTDASWNPTATYTSIKRSSSAASSRLQYTFKFTNTNPTITSNLTFDSSTWSKGSNYSYRSWRNIQKDRNIYVVYIMPRPNSNLQNGLKSAIIYELSIRNAGVTVFDLVAAYNKNTNRYGLYDLISGEFYDHVYTIEGYVCYFSVEP